MGMGSRLRPSLFFCSYALSPIFIYGSVSLNDGVNGFERPPYSIDRPRLSADVLADLNPIGEDQLSAEVAGNRTITFNDLDPQVVADLNDSVAHHHQLNEQILKYLRPEISQNPVLTKDREQVYTGQTITLSSNAEGKFLSYQWLKNGEPVPGATNREFTITDANGSLHNGNYTVQVSNDFGSVSGEGRANRYQ